MHKLTLAAPLAAVLVAAISSCGAAAAAVGGSVYTYESWGGGGSASMVAYSRDADGNFFQQGTTVLPWSVDVDMQGAALVTPLSLQAVAADGVAEIHCRIKHGTVVMIENVGSGIVTCDATS